MPCQRTKEFLSSKGVAYRDVNVMEDIEGRDELLRRTGQMAVPVIVVGDEVIVGFDKPGLASALGIVA